jgi:hypothetical protein
MKMRIVSFNNFGIKESIGSGNTTRFVAIRNERGDAVIAIIDLELVGITEKDILSHLCEAVQKWVTSDEIGKKVAEDTGGDFNFGDLAMYQDNDGLVSCLSEVGINNLSVEILDTNIIMDFDLRLL